MRLRLPLLALLLAPVPAGCVPGSDPTTGNTGAGLPPELVYCRANLERPFQDSEIALRTAQNLGTARVADRTGRELHVRTHPDGVRVVFARERTANDEDSRELFVSSVDGSIAELRLTGNNVADDTPCWSPTGDRVLFGTARDGERRLYLCEADGAAPRPFILAVAGVEDRDPDWSRAGDRVAWSRRETGGVRRLWIANGDGGGALPLTVGLPAPAGVAEAGDREPTFSPDGAQVAFVRFSAPGRSRLMVVEVASGNAVELHDPQGSIRLPRYAPAGDRLLFGIDQPDQGRPGSRLAMLPAAGGVPLLVEPGEQWLLDGIDVLPALPAAPNAEPPEVLDVGNAEVQIAIGTPVLGNREMLRDADGQSLVLATTTFQGTENAGINCRFTLPVATADRVLALQIRIVARITRSDGDSVLRSSLHNPVTERFDTVVELPDPGTAMRTMSFATQSLAHVSAERQVRVTVVGQIGAGARAELHVDQVQVTLVRRSPP